MKTFYTALLCFFFAAISLQAAAQPCTTCTFTHSNSGTKSYSLEPGQTLCIKKDFTGDITNFPAGATICIDSKIIFQPKTFNNAGGTIINRGTFSASDLTVASGFTLLNYGTVTIADFTANTNGTIENFAGATFRAQSVIINTSGVFRNSGDVYIAAGFTINSSSSFANQADAKFYVERDLTVNGPITNQGYLRVKGNTAINSGISIINHCAFVFGGNVTNNAAVKNFGNIIMTGTGASFSGNGNIYNGPTGFVQGHHFSINGDITGGGNFRFTGNTTGNGKIGVDNDAFVINFYDVTLANGKRFTDDGNFTFGDVTRSAINAKDTTMLLNNCGMVEESVLPLKLTAFYGQLVNDKVKLDWQVADNQTGSHFELQRSSNGSNFKTQTLLFTSEKEGNETYSFSDAATFTDKVFYRLKMVNKDQSVSYSSIVFFSKQAQSSSSLTLLQNPVQSAVHFNYTATGNSLADVSVYNISGVKIFTLAKRVQKGTNSFTIQTDGRFAKGMYVLEVKSNGQRHTTKFIRQ